MRDPYVHRSYHVSYTIVSIHTCSKLCIIYHIPYTTVFWAPGSWQEPPDELAALLKDKEVQWVPGAAQPFEPWSKVMAPHPTSIGSIGSMILGYTAYILLLWGLGPFFWAFWGSRRAMQSHMSHELA